MKHILTLSIAAVLIGAGALAQAEDGLESGSNATIVESAGMTGAGGGAVESPHWKNEYPFPSFYGRAVD